ncbi:MAG TPA: efflux transporter outer membrane subunit, partial [Burkholderiales bacterium]|nr:efflux transporter outer membrane subunit [Burkholderiales bacterium]
MKTSNAMIPVVLAATLALGACAVGPDYVRPTVTVPSGYKEMADWKLAEPRDDAPKGEWWAVFADPLLSELMKQVSVSNQTLAAAEAQYRQARALAQGARAQLFPVLNADLNLGRSQAARSGTSATANRGIINTHSTSLDATWEADVWGRVRRLVEANVAAAQASAGDVEAAKLSIQSELAQNYFQLRALDTQRQLFDDTVKAFETSLKLTQNRYDAGVAARADVVQALAQLKTTQSQALDIGVQRAQLEHAIAVLVGRAPSEFSLPPAPPSAVPPPMPPGLPSALLERRPDIAAAERRIAAANARIGVAQAAFFPALSLTATGGFQSTNLATWFNAPARFWSVGAALAQTLFDAGARAAQTAQAVAAYDAEVANYRQTVLTGFREVEDNLATLRILEQAASVQTEAVEASRQSVALALNQYKAGTVSYL